MIKSIYERAKVSIRNFASDPINNLAVLIPVAIGVVALISGIVTYIMFIVNGGYVAQVDAIKKFGIFDGYDEKFTAGTTGMIFTGIVGKIIAVFVGAEFILMMTNYFRNSGKGKRIIMIVDLVLLTIQIVLIATIFWIAIGNIAIAEEAAYEEIKPFKVLTINPKAVLITYAVITLVSIITFIVLVLITKECRWMMGYTALSLGFSYIVIPLLFLFLQNVIPLATGAVALVIVVAVIYFGFKIFLSEDSEGGGSSSSSGSSYTSSSSRSNNTYSASRKVEKAPYQEVKKYDLNTTFWRDKGGYGVMVPMADCIYYKNAWGEKAYACTVSDFEKGKVAIINKGSRVMNVAGCKTPER